MSTRPTIAALALLALPSCHDPCLPELELVDSNAKVLAAAAGVEGGASPGNALPEGDLLLITHRLPAGVDLEEKIVFRVETPCTCTTFTRSPVELASEDKSIAQAKCSMGYETTIPLVVPEGGGCRLSVTSTISNDTRTVVLEGDDCDLKCTSDVRCTDGLEGDGGGSADNTGGAGGAGGTAGAGG